MTGAQTEDAPSRVVAVVGCQWGDEGKGKLVEALAQKSVFCGRFNGGSNAGHSVLTPDGKSIVLHLLPCGITNPQCLNIIGNGVVLNIEKLEAEIQCLANALVDDSGSSPAGSSSTNHSPTNKSATAEAEAKAEKEAERIRSRLLISGRAHLLIPAHIAADMAVEARLGASAIGSTKQGIGPCYAMKALRVSLRAHDLLLPRAAFIAKYKKTENFIHSFFNLTQNAAEAEEGLQRILALKTKYMPYLTNAEAIFADNGLYRNNVRTTHEQNTVSPQLSAASLTDKAPLILCLIEGANATHLDLDVGTFPFVTSSNTTVAGIGSGLGLPVSRIDECVGVVKAYTTRVGNGPFPTELAEGDLDGDHMRSVGREFGATTGRPRRCGWLDMVVVNYAIRTNGLDSIMLTKLDVLSGLDTLKICVSHRLRQSMTKAELEGCHDETEKKLIEDWMKRQQGHDIRDPAVRAPMCPPIDLEDVEACEYITLPGWKEDLSQVRVFEDFPENARNYCHTISRLLECDCRLSLIGIGPSRSQIIDYTPESTPN